MCFRKLSHDIEDNLKDIFRTQKQAKWLLTPKEAPSGTLTLLSDDHQLRSYPSLWGSSTKWIVSTQVSLISFLLHLVLQICHLRMFPQLELPSLSFWDSKLALWRLVLSACLLHRERSIPISSWNWTLTSEYLSLSTCPSFLRTQGKYMFVPKSSLTSFTFGVLLLPSVDLLCVSLLVPSSHLAYCQPVCPLRF